MNRKKKWPWLAALICVSLLLVIVYWWVFGQPVYQGRSLSSWFREATIQRTIREDSPATVAIKSMGRSAVPFLVGKLRHEDTKWDILWRKAYPKMPPLLKKCFAEPLPSHPQQEAAAMLLGEIGPPAESAFPQMLAEYNRACRKQLVLPRNPDWSVLLTNPPAPLPLSQQTNELELSTRLYLLRAFTTIGGTHKQTIPLLLAAIHDPGISYGYDVATWIASSTNLMPSIRLAEPSLIAAAADSHSIVRFSAARLLASFAPDHPEVVPPLLKAASDADPAVRRYALQSLANTPLPPETLLPLAVKVLDDPERSLRNSGVRILMKSANGNNAFLTTLTNALENRDPVLRTDAAKLLGFFGARAKPALPKLTELTNQSNEPDAQVRQEAAAAVARISAMEVRK